MFDKSPKPGCDCHSEAAAATEESLWALPATKRDSSAEDVPRNDNVLERSRRCGSAALAFAATVLLLFCAGCRIDMHVQPRYNPYDPSYFWSDGQSARQPVPGTVPRGELTTGSQQLLYTGKVNGDVADTFPFLVTREVMQRGQERYNIYCTPCHGWAGDGDGMIVQRGLSPPPSFHLDRLRTAPAGHFFDVMTNGFGLMFPYSDRIQPRDRWAIVAYIRALQLSRQGTINDVPEQDRQKLMSQPQ